MNFLLHAFEDGLGEDAADGTAEQEGWGSDEDLDLSDTGYDDDEINNTDPPAVPIPPSSAISPAQQQQQQYTHYADGDAAAAGRDENTTAGNTTVPRGGGGMFLGRFTRLLDVVAPPPPLPQQDHEEVKEESAPENGWNDDDDIDIDGTIDGWDDVDEDTQAQAMLSMLVHDDNDNDNDAHRNATEQNNCNNNTATNHNYNNDDTILTQDDTFTTTEAVIVPMSEPTSQVALVPPAPTSPSIATSAGHQTVSTTAAMGMVSSTLQTTLDEDITGLDLDDTATGWVHDDALDLDLDLEVDLGGDDAAARTNYVVDHIPPPAPDRNELEEEDRGGRKAATDGEEDDISQDDTLSIANSRSQQQHAAFLPEGGTNNGRTLSTSTIGDEDGAADDDGVDPPSVSSMGSNSNVSSAGGGSSRLVSPKPRKVVDCTPRFTRGTTGDVSLLVSGHTSVGESLESIDEANEEDYDNDTDLDNAETLRKRLTTSLGVVLPLTTAAEAFTTENTTTATPRTMESGWGALRSHSAEQSIEPSAAEIPFGSALTPTAHNNSCTYDRTTTSINDYDDYEDEEGDSMVPLVDQTPTVSDHPRNDNETAQLPRPASRRSMTSVDVLSVSSEEGDLGESDIGIDDIKEELYGPMVDQIPPTPRSEDGVDNLTARQASMDGEGSTVVGQAEKVDVENDIREDDAMSSDEEDGDDDDNIKDEDGDANGGDESGWGSILEIDFDNRSLLSGLPLPVVDETQHLVDHVPVDRLLRGGGGGGGSGIGIGIGIGGNSTMVATDASANSSRADDDDDGPHTNNFGPIVDHTPPSIATGGVARGTQSITTSVVTAVSGLERDIKEDDDMDQTTIDGGGGATASSTVADDELDDNDIEDDHIVDQVPREKCQNPIQDASIRVLHDKEDDLTQGDTIAEDAAIDFGLIVDQTPFVQATSGLSVEGSMMAQRNQADDINTATLGSVSIQDDDESGWDHDDHDLDDLMAEEDAIHVQNDTNATKEENNLVDHIPNKTFSKPIDGSTMVLVDPMDAASDADDTDDDTAGNARTDKFGPVVDHTPTPQSAPVSIATSMMKQAYDNRSDICHENNIDGSTTWFGASTLGGISSTEADGSILADDDSGRGWDDDAGILDDLISPVIPRIVRDTENVLVDHVPSDTSTHNVDTNASLAVAVDPSVISSQSIQDGNLFGAVVDHTPSVEPTSHGATDSSTLATGIATNIKREDEMDETTWQGGVSAEGEEWDQNDPELIDLGNDNEEEVVVDHVPERPASKHADPSLVVAANPSELSSQVEDLNQDENHFGPVVDQTPLERFPLSPAVGSTAVALPSVMNDDLDDGDADEQNTEAARIPSEWEDQLPNPQSANDAEDTSEQLVDAVPPPLDQQATEMVRDASSEMATIDDTLIPADDPKEDEFGPVVDHTPTGGNNDGIQNSIIGSLSDDEDDKKIAADQNNVDSVAPMYSAQSKDEDNDFDEDGFGPVVDQLPATSSKSSLALSKGGSTVDAKATLSEDDINTRDGWDDDTIDNVDQTSPTNTSHRANYSVTWGDSVSDKDDSQHKMTHNVSKQSDEIGDSGFFTAAMSDSSEPNLDQTKFYDVESSVEMNGWGDDSLNIVDDDTLPSTPRSNTIAQPETVDCCLNVDSTDCPCVQALITNNTETNDVVGFWRTPDGAPMQVNLQKLLQNETTKRMLIEKESQALRQTIELLKQAKNTLITTGETQAGRENDMMSAINEWQEANGELSKDNSKLNTHNGKLSTEIDTLSKDLSQSRNKNGKLSIDNSKLQHENRNLSDEVLNLESQSAQLRNTNDILKNELDVARKSISQLEDEKTQIQSQETALSAEISSLKLSLEKSIQESTSDINLQDEIRSIQSELASKVSECSQLNSQLNQVRAKLTKSEALNFKHTKDVAKVTKNHMNKISDLQEKLDTQKIQLEDSKLLNEECIAGLKQSISNEAAARQTLQGENVSLKQRNQDLQTEFENSARIQQQDLSQKDVTICSLETKLKNIEDQKIQLSNQIRNYAKQIERFSSISTDHESISKERDVLKEALTKSKSYIAGLQQQFDDLNSSQLNSTQSQMSTLKEERANQSIMIELHQNQIAALTQEKANQSHQIEHSNDQIITLNQENANRLLEIESSNHEISVLTHRINEIELEKNSIDIQFEEFRKSHVNSQNTSAVSALNAAKDQAKLKKMQSEVQQLRLQLKNTTDGLRNSENERTRFSSRCTELESEIARLGQLVDGADSLQQDLFKFQQVNGKQERRIEHLESNLSQNEHVLLLKDQEIANLRDFQDSNTTGVENQNRDLLQKLNETNGKLQETSSRLFNLESDIQDKNSTLDSLNNKLSELINEKDQLQNEKESLLEETDDMLVQFGLLNEEMMAKETDAARVEEELTRLKEERHLYEDELQELRGRVQAQAEELRSKDITLEEELRLKAEEFRSKEDELRTKENELRSKDSAHEQELRSKTNELRSKDSAHEQELRSKENELRSKDSAHEQELRSKDDAIKSKDNEFLLKEVELQNDLQLARRKSHTYEDQLHESEEKLNVLIKESEEIAKNNIGNLDESNKKLIGINTALREKLRDVSSEQSVTASRIRTMESEKEGLNGKVDDLQNLVDELIASFETKEGNLQSIINDINFQKADIINKFETQDTELSRLNQELEVSNGAAEELETLRHRLADSENQLSEQNRLLRQKDAALEDLHNQLDNSGNIPVVSAELEILRQTNYDLESTIATDKNQLEDMGIICDETQQELTRTIDQLKISDDLVQQLQTDLKSKEETESTNRMDKLRLDELEEVLTSTRNEEKKQRSEADELRQKVSDLETRSGEGSTELETLRQQIELFQREKTISLSSPSTAAEERMKKELRSLRERIAEKDDRMSNMDQQLQSVNIEFRIANKEMEMKDQNIAALTAELGTLKASLATMTSTSSSPSRVLELSSQKNQADVDDVEEKMRSQIVSLAQALEHSESHRADVIETIETERHANADSLRRMTENVKRFYTTLNMSDA